MGDRMMTPGYLSYVTSPTCWVIFWGSMLATTCLTPLVMRVAHKIGAVQGVEYRKIHQGTIPLIGGLAIALPFLAVVFGSFTSTTGMFAVVQSRHWDLVVLGVGCIAIVALGIVDDVFGLRARFKLLGQIAIALFVATSGSGIESLNLPVIGNFYLGDVAGTLLTVFWIVGVTNAINLIDGMDGLAAGVALIASVAFAIIAAVNGATFVVLLCIALAGSLIAFLKYNWYPARIFLGDTGSLFLGFTLATISLMGSYKATGGMLLLSAIMALGIPIFETFVSMLRRYLSGFPIFSADSHHTHHRLLNKGFTQHQVAIILYAGALFCLIAAVSSTALSARSPESLIPLALFLVTLIAIATIAGYARAIMIKFGRRQETVRRLAFSRYAALSLTSEATVDKIHKILSLLCYELRLDFVEVRFDQGKNRIISNGTTKNPDGAPHPGDVRSFLLKMSNGEISEVLYQHDHDADETEEYTVAACLASVFERISPDIPKERVTVQVRLLVSVPPAVSERTNPPAGSEARDVSRGKSGI